MNYSEQRKYLIFTTCTQLLLSAGDIDDISTALKGYNILLTYDYQPAINFLEQLDHHLERSDTFPILL